MPCAAGATGKIEELIRRERTSVLSVDEIPAKWILLLTKKNHDPQP
jgi:hypothetical protein